MLKNKYIKLSCCYELWNNFCFISKFGIRVILALKRYLEIYQSFQMISLMPSYFFRISNACCLIKAKKMSTIPINNYEEMAELLRDFMQDYSWLFNFSNINIILDDFVGKVNIIIELRNHVKR